MQIKNYNSIKTINEQGNNIAKKIHSLQNPSQISWRKKNANLFEVAMGAYDGSEVCLIVGLFLLNNLANKFYKNDFDLHRDDGLVILKNVNAHREDQTRKEFYQLFKENGLPLEIQCNLKTIT